MAFALRSLLLLCGISALLTGVWSDGTVKVPCCPKNWVRLEDRCLLVVKYAFNFEEAELTCNALGGNLVSIHNDIEHVVVRALIDTSLGDSEHAWIGYNDRNPPSTEGDFVWTDLTPDDFNNFNGAPPSNADEDCVQTTGAFWEDEDCTSVVPFVCAKNVH